MITHRDTNGIRRVSTRTMTSGAAKTAYFDQLSKPMLTVGVYKDGTAATKHYDPDGSLRIALGVEVNGAALAQYIDRPTSDEAASDR